MTSTTTFHLVRQGTAAKLGANSMGTISYVVLIDAHHTEPFIALTGNDGGGYFSREAVPISALRHCAGQTRTNEPLSASAFKTAFVGRSSNNGYFAVAALCAEGLLNRIQREGPGRGQPLADAGIWDEWCAKVHAQVAAQDEGLPVFQVGKPAASEPTVGGDCLATATVGEGEAAASKPAAFTEASEDAGETGDQSESGAKARRRGKVKV